MGQQVCLEPDCLTGLPVAPFVCQSVHNMSQAVVKGEELNLTRKVKQNVGSFPCNRPIPL